MSSEVIKAVLQADSSDLRAEFNKAQNTVSSLDNSFKTLGSSIVGALSVGAVVGAFNSIRDSIDKLDYQSKRLQMPVEEFQKLSAVAALSDASVESLGKGLTRAGLAATEASQGSKEIAKQFAILGIEIDAFRSLGATEQLAALATGFNGLTNRGDATNAIFKIMGKGAAELIPVLQGGAKGIEEISRRLEVLDGPGVAAVAAMNDEITLLSANLKNNLARSFVGLEPLISDFITNLSDAFDGLKLLSDPTQGVGSDGGKFGGLEMLKEIESLKSQLEGLRLEAEKPWLLRDNNALSNYEDAKLFIDRLTHSFQKLNQEDQIAAQRLQDLDVLRDSGVSGEELQTQLAAIERQVAEKLKAIQLEKDLAEAAKVSAGALEVQAQEMEKAAKEAAKIAQELDKLREQNNASILDRLFPTERIAAIQEELDAILAKTNNQDIAGLVELTQDPGFDTESALSLQKDLAKALDLTKKLESAEKDVSTARREGINAEASLLKIKESSLKTAGAELKAALDKVQAQEDFTKALANEEKVRQTFIKQGAKAAREVQKDIDFQARVADVARQGGELPGHVEKQLRQGDREKEQIREIEDLGRLSARDRLARRREIRDNEQQEEREFKRMEKFRKNLLAKEERENRNAKFFDKDLPHPDLENHPAQNAAERAAAERAAAEQAIRSNSIEQLQIQKEISRKLDALAAISAD